MASDPANDDTVEPDSFDAILKQVVRAPAVGGPPRELATGEVIGGRFTIERALGTGGMGTVYAASDQTLGRTVAIKVHHAAGGGVRLRREAIAMARLAHPNVVTVFEVGELDQRPFVVMEYVIGTTLREWLAAEPRDASAILAVMIEAGEGLAAAHAAGLIHRDIKPENVLIGSDGRTRVGDFGLARDRDSKDDTPPASAPDRLLSPMTQTGAVLGTPAYMAPEQVSGQNVDARTDQFSYCVTAWEALWGERPFVGATFEQLLEALTSGTRRPLPPLMKVPPHVRIALERGLSRDPEARFPTMQALLAALRPPLPKRRRRWAIGALIAGVAFGGVGIYAVMRREPPPSCDGLATPSFLAANPAAAARYMRATRVACEAANNHTWAPEIVAKSRACIEIAARVEIASVVDGSSAHRNDCLDPTNLAVSPPVPTDPAKLAAFIAARAEIEITYAIFDRIPRTAIEATIAHLTASPAADSTEIAPAIAILRGRILAFDGDLAASDKVLADAYYAARAIDDTEDLLQALVGLIDNATQLRVDHGTVDQWLRAGLADAERMRTRAPWFATRMYFSDAHVANEEEDAPRALADLAKIRKLMGADDQVAVAADMLEGEVLMWSGKLDEGLTAYDKGFALAAKLHREDTQQVIDLANYASSLLGASRYEQAADTADRAMKLIDKMPDRGDLVDGTRVNLAATFIGIQKDDEARPLLELARRNTVARYGEHNARVANIDGNLALIDSDRGDHAAALARLQGALAIEEEQLGKDSTIVGARVLTVAVMLGKLGRTGEALVTAQRALAIFTAKSPGSPQQGYAKLQVATFLRETADPAPALALADEVIATLTTTDADETQILALAQLERGHALLDLGRKTEAHAAFAISRPMYERMSMTARIAEIATLDRRTH